ncbi:TetR/AcrR family transcriptional regulator C-terminal ligand-binding domain-containing protein [Microbacterium sp. NPDC058389]|uniref:TetR/AcrR family transcriptional regulator n=1 Tax=Microbacterium sp. NPDC058389 TaxID=3346475 RepID=UPI003653E52B
MDTPAPSAGPNPEASPDGSALQAVGTTRPGGRTARTRTAVLAAVRELIAETGEAMPGIPSVAERSGVHAATIYRRWRTPEALLIDVALADVNERSPIPVTGDLRADLTAYTTQLIGDATRPGGLSFLHALAAAAENPDVGAAALPSLVEPRMEQFQRMLDAGGATRLTPMDLLSLLIAPVSLGTMLGALPEDVDAAAAQLVDNVIAVEEHRRRGRR